LINITREITEHRNEDSVPFANNREYIASRIICN